MMLEQAASQQMSSLIKKASAMLVVFCVFTSPANAAQPMHSTSLAQIMQINAMHAPGKGRADAMVRYIQGLSAPELAVFIEQAGGWHIVAQIMKSRTSDRVQLRMEFISAMQSHAFRSQINSGISNYILNTQR